MYTYTHTPFVFAYFCTIEPFILFRTAACGESCHDIIILLSTPIQHILIMAQNATIVDITLIADKDEKVS